MIKIIKPFLFSALLFLGSFAYSCIHLEMGLPKESDFIDCRLGYAIGYNYSQKSAEWVSYELKEQVGDGVSRSNDFRVDPALPVQYQTTPDDYDEPVYDQGHLANSESLDLSDQMMSESFYMSNMVPQLPKHNRAIWKGTENLERRAANNRGRVFVFSGPLYEGEASYIGNGVPVPSHLWKVIYEPNTYSAIAFIIEHKALKTKDLKNYIVSVDEVESRAGIDLLNVFYPQDQEIIEKSPQSKLWSK